MANQAQSIGHGAWGIGFKSFTLCPLLYAVLPVPSVLCSMRRSSFHNIQLDRKLPELGRGHPRRRLGHEAYGLLGLGEGDDVADGLRARQDGREPVQAEGEAAVGWRAVL